MAGFADILRLVLGWRSVVVPPDQEAIEVCISPGRTHWALDSLCHARIPEARAHARIVEEDR